MTATRISRAGILLQGRGGRSAGRARSRRWSAARLVPMLGPPALLAAGAIVAGGVPGFLLGFIAALLLVDRALGSTGASRLEAESAFARLARARRLARLLRRTSGDGLAYLAEDAGWAAIAQRRRLGIESIAIASIVGTVDPRKATTFDRSFRPPSWSRGRWTQMYLAARRGTALPPISVYRAGGEHYVRDGHHRVSVARALGADSIDANVVELDARERPA